jgi:predicted MFS family arabinose efflux permease
MRIVNVRYLAIAAAGGTAFLDMYATQPLLPELRNTFHANESAVALTVSAITYATACAAPFIGPLADAIGRKRVILTAIAFLTLATLGAATAHSISELVVWRILQGLAMPGIFAVTLAYIAEELPAGEVGRATAAYIGGNVLGGFLGRYIAALVGGTFGIATAFAVLASLTLAGGIVVAFALPRSRKFRKGANAAGAIRAMGRFVRMPRLLATYAVGGSILFTLVAAFTFATFHLAAAPFSLSTVAIGNVFFVYLADVIGTPLAGRLIDRFGNRATVIAAMATAVCGISLTLVPSLVAIVVGLAITSTCVFVSQAASQSYIGKVVREQRSSAAALYLVAYYLCGGLGAQVPTPAWEAFGWPGVVAVVVAVQILAATTAWFGWRGEPRTIEPAVLSV